MVSIKAPSGFRDFLQDDARRRLQLMNTISSVYQAYGFSPLETPALENLGLLLGKGGGGEENEKLIFKVMKRGKQFEDAVHASAGGLTPAASLESQFSDLGLRFDLTLPLSRVVANHRGQIRLPWKVFHMGPVWRAERPQAGRFREFVQCDVDIIGAKGIGAEIEVIQAAVEAVHRVGASGFELRINDRRLIQAMGEKAGFAGDKLEKFAVLLDKKDKMELSELLDHLQLLAGEPLSGEARAIVTGNLDLDSAYQFHPEAAQDLKSIISILTELKLPLTGIIFDPSLVRGMGYYTGPVFELRHQSAGYSFGGGGRYDRLIGRFANEQIPACGFSIGFERLVLLLAEIEHQSDLNSKTVFIPVFDEALRGKIALLARDLRRGGLTVDVFPDQAKIKNQFKFASDQSYRWVLIAGPDEWTSQIFKLKDFQTGAEISVVSSDTSDSKTQLIQNLRLQMGIQ